MQRQSDSNFTAVTRFRRPESTCPPIFLDHPSWRRQGLQQEVDEIELYNVEMALNALMEEGEGEIDPNAIVVTLSGNSSVAAERAKKHMKKQTQEWKDVLSDLQRMTGVQPANKPTASATENNTSHSRQESNSQNY